MLVIICITPRTNKAIILHETEDYFPNRHPDPVFDHNIQLQVFLVSYQSSHLPEG